MRKFTIYHVFLFFLVLFVALGTLSFFFPKEGIQMGNIQLRFISFQKLINPVKKVNKAIPKFIQNIDTTIVDIKEESKIKHLNERGNFGQPSNNKIVSHSATAIHFSEHALKSLHLFFEKLDKVALNNSKIHILHYGDSQIEGDRMTAYIRQRLQEQFGGNGPGLIPANNVYNTMSFKQSYSPNFKRYALFANEKIKSRKYGVLASVARFTKEYSDSSEIALQNTENEAWIEIEPSPSAYNRARKYNNVYMYYTSCIKPCEIKVYQNDILIHEDSLIADNKFHIFPLNFKNQCGKIKYVFSAKISPNILGFSLEGDIGVQVDNIAMRGSSGTFVGNMDQSLFSTMMGHLNTELIIMQFGGNSVPYLKDSSAVRNYARQFKGQLASLKRLNPHTSILVIGPSDMSIFIDGYYQTYPLLPYLVACMKRYSNDIGAGYWDLFQAMGGENSMPTWVEKGLAGQDYIHFSNRGSSIASQLFYEAFAVEYSKWKNNE